MYRVALSVSPRRCARLPRSFMWSCCAAATPTFANFTTSTTMRGAEYEDPLLMAWTLADARTQQVSASPLLPVLYERAGFCRTRSAARSAPVCHQRRLGARCAAPHHRKHRGWHHR